MADYMTEYWFKLLTDAAAADPRGIQGVADRLGISRTQVSLVLSGKYQSPRKIAALAMAAFDRHLCPYLGVEIAADDCRNANTGPVPTWDPSALDQRRTCQTCPHKPEQGGSK